MKFVLYQLRHGGPSHDRLHDLRTRGAVKDRGRWASDSSLRRYEAHARVQQVMQKLTPAQRKEALESEAK
eukprot:1505344-Lingulodinium_polyedra.AAC.1